jgi:hypothetical protein
LFQIVAVSRKAHAGSEIIGQRSAADSDQHIGGKLRVEPMIVFYKTLAVGDMRNAEPQQARTFSAGGCEQGFQWQIASEIRRIPAAFAQD